MEQRGARFAKIQVRESFSVLSFRPGVASAVHPSSVQIAAQHFMESESGTAVGKESMRPQSADLEQSSHWLARRHVTSLLNSDWLASLCLRWCMPTSHLLERRAGPAPLTPGTRIENWL